MVRGTTVLDAMQRPRLQQQRAALIASSALTTGRVATVVEQVVPMKNLSRLEDDDDGPELRAMKRPLSMDPFVIVVDVMNQRANVTRTETRLGDRRL